MKQEYSDITDKLGVPAFYYAMGPLEGLIFARLRHS